MLDMLNADLLLVPQVCELEIEILLSSSIHRLRLGEEIIREYDDPVKQTAGAGFQELNDVARKTAAVSKYIHAVILVLKANDPRLKDGIYSGTLQKIREYFRTHGNNGIIIKITISSIVIGLLSDSSKPNHIQIVFQSIIHI